jgi:hypothetical protein
MASPALGALQGVALEEHGQVALLGRHALAPEGEDVVPAVAVEQAAHQRSAQDLADLVAAHAGLERLHLLAGDEIPLHDLHLVGSQGRADTVAHVVEGAAAGQ